MKDVIPGFGSTKVTRALVFLNLAVTITVFFLFRAPHGGDMYTYLGLADGILHGTYSFWWWLPIEVPDTLRNPGYPLFLAIFRAFSDKVILVQLVQVVLYFLSALFVTKTIRAIGGGTLAINTFLLLLLPSINIAYYNTGIYAEPLTMFLICSFVLVETTWSKGWRRTLVLGLLVGAAFQCRSSLLLFPMAWILVRFFAGERASEWRTSVLFITVFVCTTIPYAYWNLRTHGMFKPTPIEGGAGVMHIGWWSGKIPGHTEHWYWGNTVNHEMFQFVEPDAIQGNIAEFEAEWATIDTDLRPLMTRSDSAMLEAQELGKGLFRTYGVEYTVAREKALMSATLEHIRAEPWYTIKFKAYTAVRLWVTGVSMDRFRNASTIGLVAELYPFLLSLSIFLLAVFIVPLAIHIDRQLLYRIIPLMLWLLYFGAIHIPFVIQARYTIPVRLLLLALIAICFESFIRRSGNRRISDSQ
jgi:hypothetical protein